VVDNDNSTHKTVLQRLLSYLDSHRATRRRRLERNEPNELGVRDSEIAKAELDLARTEFGFSIHAFEEKDSKRARDHLTRSIELLRSAREHFESAGDASMVTECDRGIIGAKLGLGTSEFHLGIAESHLGIAESEQNNPEETRDHLTRSIELLRSAREHFESAGDASMVTECDRGISVVEPAIAISEFNLGTIKFEQKDFPQARDCYTKSITYCSSAREYSFSVGHAEEVAGYDERIATARINLGACELHLGIAESEQNNPEETRDHFVKSIAYYERAKGYYTSQVNEAMAATCDRWIAEAEYGLGDVQSLIGHDDDARKHFQLSLRLFERLSEGEWARRCQVRLSILDAALQDEDSTHEGISLLDLPSEADAFDGATASLQGASELIVTLMMMHQVGNKDKAVDFLSLHRRDFERVLERGRREWSKKEVAGFTSGLGFVRLKVNEEPSSAIALFEEAYQLFEDLGDSQSMTACELWLARALHAEDRDQAALTHAIRAVVILDRMYYRFSKFSDRQAWARGAYAQALDLALSLAFELGDQEKLALLIESARVQAVPVAEGDEDKMPIEFFPLDILDDQGEVLGAPLGARPNAAVSAAIGDSEPLGPPHGVRLVDGGSLGALVGLGDYAPDEPNPPEVISIARTAQLVTEESPYWFGSWVGGGILYWYLLSPDSSLAVGSVPMESISPLVKRFQDALPHNGETSVTHQIAISPLVDPKEELALAKVLGDLLIPEALREVLASSEAPISLIVAPAPEVAIIPSPWLAIDEEGTRLIERAIVHLGASVGLLHESVKRSSSETTIVMLDPTGELLVHPHGPTQVADDLVSLASEHVLSAQAHVGALAQEFSYGDRQPRVLMAAPEHFVSSLREPPERTHDPSLLFYLGHADPGSTPATSSLRLMDPNEGGVVGFYARNFYREELTVPERVLIIACNGMAHDSKEWLGLGPAALFAGARFVLAALWSLPWAPVPTGGDYPTWRLAKEALLVARGDDPIRGWREVQLGELERWRAHGAVEASPLFWAGLGVMGLRS